MDENRLVKRVCEMRVDLLEGEWGEYQEGLDGYCVRERFDQ